MKSTLIILYLELYLTGHIQKYNSQLYESESLDPMVGRYSKYNIILNSATYSVVFVIYIYVI